MVEEHADVETAVRGLPVHQFCQNITMDEEEKMLSLRDMFGSKSPHTIQKRASTLLRLFRWLQKQAEVQGTSVEEPLLPSEEAVYKFCREISHRKKGKLAPQSVVQALKFVKFVLSIPDVENSISQGPRLGRPSGRRARAHTSSPGPNT